MFHHVYFENGARFGRPQARAGSALGSQEAVDADGGRILPIRPPKPGPPFTY